MDTAAQPATAADARPGGSAGTVDAVIARIRAFAAAKGWARSRFAVAAGLAPNTLRDFDAPGWSPTAETLRKLEALIPADFVAPPAGPAAEEGGQ